MTGPCVLDARNLEVTFPSRLNKVQALSGFNLQIPTGALFVLLGSNGAGKTTLMRCITGLVEPTAGTLSIFGSSIDSKEARPSNRENLARLGVLIENPGVYNRMDARAYLMFFGAFYPIQNLEDRIKTLCGDLGLVLDNKPVAKLSQGNRQKLQLIRSLLHRPDFLLWDEPTDHLDPVSQKQILQYLRHYLGETGATALIATHRLEQMESVASHFGFIAQGKLVRMGDREEILGGGSMFENGGVEKNGEAFRLGFARSLGKDELQELSESFNLGIQHLTDPSEAWLFKAPGLRLRMPAVIQTLVNRGLPLVTVEPVKPSLSDIYEFWVNA